MRKTGNKSPGGFGNGMRVRIKLPRGETPKTQGLWSISLGGLFIEMAEPLTFGAEAGFEFTMNPGRQTVSCKGFVIWSTKDSPHKAPGKTGMAVRLTELSLAEMRLISEALQRTL